MNNEKNIEILKKIDAYAKGALSDEEIDALWHEFAKEPDLLDQLEIEVGLRKLLESNAKSTTDKSSGKIHSMPGWIWYVSAAAAVLIVALIQFFNVESPTQADQFIVQNIPNNQLEFADVLRSDDFVLSAPDSLLNLGFEAAYSGNSSKALQIYKKVIDDYNMEPYASKAYLNTGIIQYNNKNFAEAIESFSEAATRAGDNRMVSEKAFWYLANAYVASGELKNALAAAQKAYSKDGIFREKAFRLFRKLSYDLGIVDFEDFENQTNDY